MNGTERGKLHCLASIILLFAVAFGCKRQTAAPSAAPPVAPTVRIAAAADLKFALEEVIAQFKTAHPNVSVTATYGSSGNFFGQLSNKAPFDLFLSADINYPKKLAEAGLADKDGVFGYARGQIVIWVPASSKLDLNVLGIRALLDPSVKKIAVANPDHAPYGRAAVAAMKSLGVYDQAKDRLVFGENIAQTAQFIQTGAADIGIIADSLAVAPPMKDKGRYAVVPVDSYPPIEQGGIVLSWAKDADAAREFKTFLTSAQGKEVLNQFGFSTGSVVK